jgi:hypothetical protein
MRSLAVMFVFSHFSVLMQAPRQRRPRSPPVGHFQPFFVIVTVLPPSLDAGALAGDGV